MGPLIGPLGGRALAMRELVRASIRGWRRGWEPGRQASGYAKLLLAQGRRFDLYLLRFPVGASVPPHRDPVAGGGHLRANLILIPAARGGEFECERAIIDRPRLKLFRPDLVTHAVRPIEAGTRWVLSLGIGL